MARGFAKPAFVASDQAPTGLDPTGFNPARGPCFRSLHGEVQ